MPNKIVVLDYGVGNLLSVERALMACGADVEMTGDPAVAGKADRLVVPGVGAFGRCIERLTAHRLDEAVRDFAARGRPLLGICVGMQMLLDVSEEFGEHPGLGLIPGRVLPVPATGTDGQAHKIPHIGWAPLKRRAGSHPKDGGILDGIEPESGFYFLHSFRAAPSNADNILAECDYHGRDICAAVIADNVFGVQFHPEKSGKAGLQVLANFLRL
jgi:glutamine amidotransferase